MTHTELANNPFMLMTHPEVVLAAMEKSADLERLNRRQCRPLDKPLLGNAGEPASDDVEASNDDIVDAGFEPATLVSD